MFGPSSKIDNDSWKKFAQMQFLLCYIDGTTVFFSGSSNSIFLWEVECEIGAGVITKLLYTKGVVI